MRDENLRPLPDGWEGADNHFRGTHLDNRYAPRHLSGDNLAALERAIKANVRVPCGVPDCPNPSWGWSRACQQYLCQSHHALYAVRAHQRRNRA